MKTNNYLSETHVTVLLLHRVLPEWLIALARGKEYCVTSNSEKFVRDDRQGTRMAKTIFPTVGLLVFFVPFTLFYLVERQEALRQIMSPSGFFSGVILLFVICLVIIAVTNSVLGKQLWVERLQELEKHICCYQSFQASLGKADGPLGIFMFIGVDEDLFRRACHKLLRELALQVVIRERCTPENYLLIEDEKKRFREVIEVLKALSVCDGDYKPYFEHANKTFSDMQTTGCFKEPLHHLDPLPVRLPELSLATC